MAKRVSDIFNIEGRESLLPGKQPGRVMARSVSACWVVRGLGISETSAGKKLNLSQSATRRAVQRGERLIAERRLSLHNETNA